MRSPGSTRIQYGRASPETRGWGRSSATYSLIRPWLWTLGPEKAFLVYALRLRRASGTFLLPPPAALASAPNVEESAAPVIVEPWPAHARTP